MKLFVEYLIEINSYQIIFDRIIIVRILIRSDRILFDLKIRSDRMLFNFNRILFLLLLLVFL